MSDFNVGDRIEIVYHANSEYRGKTGKIVFVGTSLKQGTHMLENNMDLPEKETRIIVSLEDNTIINNLQEIQLRKM